MYIIVKLKNNSKGTKLVNITPQTLSRRNV